MFDPFAKEQLWKYHKDIILIKDKLICKDVHCGIIYNGKKKIV